MPVGEVHLGPSHSPGLLGGLPQKRRKHRPVHRSASPPRDWTVAPASSSTRGHAMPAWESPRGPARERREKVGLHAAIGVEDEDVLCTPLHRRPYPCVIASRIAQVLPRLQPDLTLAKLGRERALRSVLGGIVHDPHPALAAVRRAKGLQAREGVPRAVVVQDDDADFGRIDYHAECRMWNGEWRMGRSGMANGEWRMANGGSGMSNGGMANGEWEKRNGEWGMANGEWEKRNGEWGMANGEWGSGMANGEWRMANGEAEWRMVNVEWRMGEAECRMWNGEWRMGKRMANGEWRMANGEWRMANGEWRMANGKGMTNGIANGEWGTNGERNGECGMANSE